MVIKKRYKTEEKYKKRNKSVSSQRVKARQRQGYEIVRSRGVNESVYHRGTLCGAWQWDD